MAHIFAAGLDYINLPCLKFAAVSSPVLVRRAFRFEISAQADSILDVFSTRALTIEEFAPCHAAIIRTCEFIPALRKVACDAVRVVICKLP